MQALHLPFAHARVSGLHHLLLAHGADADGPAQQSHFFGRLYAPQLVEGGIQGQPAIVAVSRLPCGGFPLGGGRGGQVLLHLSVLGDGGALLGSVAQVAQYPGFVGGPVLQQHLPGLGQGRSGRCRQGSLPAEGGYQVVEVGRVAGGVAHVGRQGQVGQLGKIGPPDAGPGKGGVLGRKLQLQLLLRSLGPQAAAGPLLAGGVAGLHEQGLRDAGLAA